MNYPAVERAHSDSSSSWGESKTLHKTTPLCAILPSPNAQPECSVAYINTSDFYFFLTKISYLAMLFQTFLYTLHAAASLIVTSTPVPLQASPLVTRAKGEQSLGFRSLTKRGISDYAAKEQLGRGSQGQVVRGTRPGYPDVAIKRPRKGSLNLDKEAKIHQMIKNADDAFDSPNLPNLLKLIEVVEGPAVDFSMEKGIYEEVPGTKTTNIR
jgi:hypothetical protein